MAKYRCILRVSGRRKNYMKAATGAMIYYYYVCDRKLWYFAHHLNMEHTSDLVQMGKLIDEESYKREKKHIMVDEMISIDFLQSWKIVHEVKKSKSVEIASIWQLKYYMWVLEKKGIEIEKGICKVKLLDKKRLIFLYFAISFSYSKHSFSKSFATCSFSRFLSAKSFL